MPPQYKPKKTLTLFYRDGLEVVKYLLGSPLFNNLMSFVPVQIYEDATRSDRVYSDYMTANDAWDYQVSSRLPHLSPDCS